MAISTHRGSNRNDWLSLAGLNVALDVDAGLGDDGVQGGAFADILRGGDGRDQLWGEAGNDTLQGGRGDDQLWGGLGNDSLEGGEGQDQLWGGEGQDEMHLGAGNDQAWGEAGDDRIFAGAGNDMAWGGQGHDLLDSGEGNDTLFGENGNDTLIGGNGNNSLSGGEGEDSITAGTGNDTIGADAGHDIIRAGEGHNIVWAGQGNDLVQAGAGNDTLTGDDGNDTIEAGAGNNTVHAGQGDDRVTTGGGADLITGDAGHDHISSGAGNDTIFANDGNDTVLAGAGHDSITGDAGQDVIHGGAGNDTIFAGEGEDLVTWQRAENAAATDFAHGGNGLDTLRLEFTSAEWFMGAVQADVARYASFLATPNAAWEAFTFTNARLTVQSFERAEVTIDGQAATLRDDAVLAVNDAFTMSEDGAFSGNVLANDSVADLVAKIEILQGPAQGKLTMGADGGFSFDPGAAFQSLRQGQSAELSFTYRVTDADGDMGEARAALTIQGANDAAGISGTATGAVTEDGTLAAKGKLAITDADAGEAGFAAASGLAGKYGSFTFDATTGEWSYQLNNASAQVQGLSAKESVQDVLKVVSLDGTASQDIVVTIQGADGLGPNLLVNGSFEVATIGAKSWAPRSDVTGWSNGGKAIEIWNEFSGKATDGNQHIEIDHDMGLDRISQSFDAATGTEYLLSFDARARREGQAVSEAFEVLWNGKKVMDVAPGSAWGNFQVKVTGGEGLDTLTFAELAAGNDSFGGLVDNVMVRDLVW
jgi:VCBS repeat-containing protein